MKHHVIIVAGGSGQRMQATVPKQFLLLNGLPVLMHTLQRFHSALPEAQLILVLPASHFPYWESLVKDFDFTVPHLQVAGGETRFHSVKNGLTKVDDGLVAVHDGVRPLVSEANIHRCFAAAQENGAAVPVMAVNESTRMLKSDGSNVALERASLRTVQTPQCFDVQLLKLAFEQAYRSDFTDDASVMEAAGHHIALVEGNEENIKITRPSDLMLAEIFLKKI